MTTAASRRVDAALVLMVLIWGVNYSLMKRTFAEIPPQPFNALRMAIAAVLFLATLGGTALAVRAGRHQQKAIASLNNLAGVNIIVTRRCCAGRAN